MLPTIHTFPGIDSSFQDDKLTPSLLEFWTIDPHIDANVNRPSARANAGEKSIINQIKISRPINPNIISVDNDNN